MICPVVPYRENVVAGRHGADPSGRRTATRRAGATAGKLSTASATSDKPMTEEEWIKERAIDVTPEALAKPRDGE